MFLLNWIPAPLHPALYRAAHRVRSQIWRIWRPKVQGVRVLAFDADGRVLLVRHTYGSDKWMPPGGGLRRGEDPVLAGARELLEETGCQLIDARLIAVNAEDLQGASNSVYIVLGQAVGKVTVDGREIAQAQFFALNDLPDHMPKGLAAGIRIWSQPLL